MWKAKCKSNICCSRGPPDHFLLNSTTIQLQIRTPIMLRYNIASNCQQYMWLRSCRECVEVLGVMGWGRFQQASSIIALAPT